MRCYLRRVVIKGGVLSLVIILVYSHLRYIAEEERQHFVSGYAAAPGETKEQRLQYVAKACKRLPEYEDIRRNETIEKWLFVDDYHRAIYCAVSKAGSSSWKYALMSLRDPTFQEPEFNMQLHYPKTLAKFGFKYLWQLPPEEREWRLRDYFKYTIVRHPLDRVVSSYRDKFLGRDEPCYRKKLGRQIKLKYRQGVNKLKEDVQFEEFIRFILDDDPLDLDRHWMSQYHLCHPCHFRYDYIAKVETLHTDAPILFARMNQSPPKLQFLNTHSDKKFSLNYMKYFRNISRVQYERLVNLYGRDFDLFGYKPPLYEMAWVNGTPTV